MTVQALPASTPSAVPSSSPSPAACWQPAFLKMLPRIRRHARIEFRHLKGDALEETVQEVVCNACCAFARLAEHGRTEAATWSSLARYAVAQVRSGRRIGCTMNVKDVGSAYCQQRKGVDVHSLYRWDRQDEEWTELVVEDRLATPADIAAVRVDFEAFLASLTEFKRDVALVLATGETTQKTARFFGLSEGRVSHIRRELMDAWARFTADKPKQPVAA